MLVTIIGKAVVVVIDDDSARRMEAGDPFTLPLKSIGLESELELVVGKASDEAIAATKNPLELLRYIFRGYEKRLEDNFEPFKVKFGEAKNDQ